MRIAFVICTLGHGKGGHFFSLRVIADALNARVDCMILNVGVKPSKILQESKIAYVFEKYDGRNPLRCAKNIAASVSNFSPDVIHSFDMPGHFWARLLGRKFRVPLVHTKCGGPNPQRYYPRVDSLVIFSKENLKFFSTKRKYENSRIEHIPNRSKAIKPDVFRIEKLSKLTNSCRTKIMRIARFSIAYERSMHQAIDFVTALNQRSSSKYQLLLIGAVQDRSVYNAIVDRMTKDVVLVTDDYFTNNASELVDFADIVIGTGRGVMEASSLGKIILVPADSRRYPVLITADTFEILFEKNFSPRIEPENNCSIDNIVELLSSDAARQALKRQSKNYFHRYFNISGVEDRYCNIYRSATFNQKIHVFDGLLNFLAMERYFLKSTAVN